MCRCRPATAARARRDPLRSARPRTARYPTCRCARCNTEHQAYARRPVPTAPARQTHRAHPAAGRYQRLLDARRPSEKLPSQAWYHRCRRGLSKCAGFQGMAKCCIPQSGPRPGKEPKCRAYARSLRHASVSCSPSYWSCGFAVPGADCIPRNHQWQCNHRGDLADVDFHKSSARLEFGFKRRRNDSERRTAIDPINSARTMEIG